MIISIALPVPLFKNFDYSVPSRLTDSNPKPIKPGIRALVPFSGRELIGVVTEIKSRQTHAETSFKLKEVITLLDDSPSLPANLLKLIRWASHYYCHPLGEAIQTALPNALRKHTKTTTHTTLLSINKWHRTDKEPDKALRSIALTQLLALFDRHPAGIWQDSLKMMGHPLSQLNTLKKKGLIQSEAIDPLSAQHLRKQPEHKITITLNPGQSAALDALDNQEKFNCYLLHGVTGSGKTEVYIEKARQVITSGKQALILIPEINLTPQTFARFQSQLDSPIGLIHSGMSAKEKLTTWHLAKNGVADIIIGTRSAIFTPFKRLGLIIVDEEHDASFKQQEGFKYSARDLAVKRAQIENIPIILGSATPSLESLFNSKHGRYQYINLAVRAGAGLQPDIHLIDIKSRTLEHGCSRPLINRIKTELDKNNQVIIFQNRRGFSPTLLCNSCGWIAQCPYCDARLTLHSAPPHLHCHHCDHKEALPPSCKKCGDHHLKPLGAGTERIESGLSQHFPDTRIIRFDRDSIKKQRDMKQLIEEIDQGDPCILIGTQMLAKGHDFHNVTLVAIIDADASLFSADFRAFEHSTQLLLQVAGRAGRGHKKGTVLIQTKHAEHPLFQPILNNNYLQAAKLELAERKACNLPPYSKMITLRAESHNQTENLTTLQTLKASLLAIAEASQTENLLLSGPLEANMARKSGVFRAYLHIYTSSQKIRQLIQQHLPILLTEQKIKCRIIVDVDPLDYI